MDKERKFEEKKKQFLFKSQREVTLTWEQRVKGPVEGKKAQEWLEKGASHHEQNRDTDIESEVETEKVLEVPDCAVGSVTHMVKTLNDAIVAVSKDTAMIQHAYQQLYKDNVARDKALEDLTAMVK